MLRLYQYDLYDSGLVWRTTRLDCVLYVNLIRRLCINFCYLLINYTFVNFLISKLNIEVTEWSALDNQPTFLLNGNLNCKAFMHALLPHINKENWYLFENRRLCYWNKCVYVYVYVDKHNYLIWAEINSVTVNIKVIFAKLNMRKTLSLVVPHSCP